MDAVATMAIAAFWTCAAVLVYVYWGYGALLALLVKARGEIPVATGFAETWPSVTILLTVHNEERNIQHRLQNLLDQEYPSGCIDILVASDGSTDRTDEIVQGFAKARPVRLVPTARVGKSAAQNLAMHEVKGEIIVLTDAEASFEPTCVRELVAPFAHESVGCTTAHLRLLERSGVVADSQGRYWRYELKLRRLESRLGILAVASGQAMAFRRSLFRDLPAFVGDDCIIPLYVAERNHRVVHRDSALAYDAMEHEDAREFRSRVRMTMRNWTGTWMVPCLLNPLRNPGYALALWSHKLLRWLGSIALLVMVVAALIMAVLGIERTIATCFMLFLLAGVVGGLMSRMGKSIPVAGSVYSFLLANAGFLVGLASALAGQRVSAYRRGDTAGVGTSS